MHLAPFHLCILLPLGSNAFYPYKQDTSDLVSEFQSLTYANEGSSTFAQPSQEFVNELDSLTAKYRRSDIDDGSNPTNQKLQKRQASDVGIVGLLPSSVVLSEVSVETPTTPDSMAINQDGGDISFYSNIEFGSKRKPFKMVIDTGSAVTWLPSSKCKSPSCIKHLTYGKDESETLINSKGGFDITYGSGAVKGSFVNDTIHLAGLEVKNFLFGLADTVSDDFVNYPIDGILGLALAHSSPENIPTIMDVLVSDGLIPAKIFGVNLDRGSNSPTHSSISFGGLDASKIDGGLGGLKFNPVVSENGLWNISIDDAFSNGQPLNFAKKTAVLDTGTALILLPQPDALALHMRIPNTKSNGETFYVPCNTDIKIEFQFAGEKYSIPKEDYIGDVVDEAENLCLSHIVGRAVLDGGAWLVGDAFLKNVYIAFDVDRKRVGFGRKVAPNTATATVLSLPADVSVSPKDATSSAKNSTSNKARPSTNSGLSLSRNSDYLLAISIAVTTTSIASLIVA